MWLQLHFVVQSVHTASVPGLFRFVDHLDRGDRGVIRDWIKRQIEFALRGRSQMIEGLGQSMQAAGLFEDIEIFEQR